RRPWGSFERFTLNEPSTVKLIHVEPGQRLSLQRHRDRDELWVALDPGAVFEVAGRRIEPEVGERVLIRAGDTHRLSSSGPAEGGASRITCAFEAVTAAGETRPLILRLGTEGALAGAPLTREAELMRAAAAAGVPSPEVIAAGGDDGPLGAEFVVMERIAGES